MIKHRRKPDFFGKSCYSAGQAESNSTPILNAVKRLFVLALLLSSCTAQFKLSHYDEALAYPAIAPYEAFALIESDTAGLQNPILIAELAFKDQGLMVDCDYATLKRLAEAKARELGGNCFRITEHVLPDWKSTCHRIKGQVLRIDNPEAFELEIPWHAERRLQIRNFRGSVAQRPFEAVTHTTIRYRTQVSPLTGKSKLWVECVFNCEESYFKRSAWDAEILEHEQVHFDLSELYARKFRQAIQEQAGSYALFKQKHEALYAQFCKELTRKHDAYDTEVYADRTQQGKWTAWVAAELEALADYDWQEWSF